MIRYRTPVLQPNETGTFARCLRVLWPYAPEGSGAMPSAADSEQMKVFEDRLCYALEHDVHAALAAVLTFDGARQWVFYTSDVPTCGRRLAAMPQEAERYPIELDAFDDPEWDYLREQVLRQWLAAGR
jgi:hypothetical protein